MTKLKRKLHRPVEVYTCQNATLLEIRCHGSFVLMQLAKMVQKHFQDLEQKELKAEKEEGMKLKRIAGQMAKMIKEFWSNIEKVVT